MIEVIHLRKSYRPKRGVPVTAVDDVSIRFPQTGMVFLLGRSGSGKSTLLNLLGGLDRYDSGDIRINGVSTKEYSQADFDSYRNASVGFIFQEYNILPEFTVGANIALAIELQGRKATSEEIERILRQVDLVGYGDRRPNELSGGQSQRVAIARALVKNPKIILADEPTGALDSATGKQVFDTLKRLSETKLVVIVSHDREYSEQYADRIIELADGRVISDVEKKNTERTEESTPVFSDGSYRVPGEYRLTEEDLAAVNEYLASEDRKSLLIRVDSAMSRNYHFETTEQPEILGTGEVNRIRSHLPLARAARIAVGTLSHKKVRLVFTVLMSVIAFVLFGCVATLIGYRYEDSVTKVFREEGVKSVYIQKQTKYIFSSDGDESDWIEQFNFTAAELDQLRELADGKVYPLRCIAGLTVEAPDGEGGSPNGDGNNPVDMLNFSDSAEFFEIDEEILAQLGCKLETGSLPDGSKDEIAISKIMYEMCRNRALLGGGKIPKMSEMIGSTVRMSNGRELVITGIIDTGLDYMRYFTALVEAVNEFSDRTIISVAMIKALVMMSDFQYDIASNLAGKNLVGRGFVDRQPEGEFVYRGSVRGKEYYNYDFSTSLFGDIADIDRYPNTDIHPGTPEDSEEFPTAGLSEVECYFSCSQMRVFLAEHITTDILEDLGINAAVQVEYERLKKKAEERRKKEAEEAGESADATLSQAMKAAQDQDGNENTGKMTKREEALEQEYYETAIRSVLRSATPEQIVTLAERYLSVRPMYLYYDNTQSRTYYEENRVLLKVLGIVNDVSDDSVTERLPYYGVLFIHEKDMPDFGITKAKNVTGAMLVLPESDDALRDIVRYCNEGNGTDRYQIVTKFNTELSVVDEMMETIKKVLLYMGAFFACFAMILFASFITSSIANKKHDVGILRAIGSKGNDVFRIFGSESCMIAFLCFLISAVLTGLLTSLGNRVILGTLHVSILNFGPVQVLLIFAIAFGTALIASFLPVLFFSRKRPIDVIRGR